MDLFATVLALADIPMPDDRPFDSVDIRPVLLGTGPSPRDTIFYYRGTKLMAVRMGPWKAHFLTQAGYGEPKPVAHDPPLLFNLDRDPSEKVDVSKDHADVIAAIHDLASKHAAGVTVVPSQLELR